MTGSRNRALIHLLPVQMTSVRPSQLDTLGESIKICSAEIHGDPNTFREAHTLAIVSYQAVFDCHPS